jgi:sigma-B regulation protein RsbU (phosphoserine phosphatase)
MSRRWKVLLILLIFSLVPLIVVTFAGQKSLVRLGETVFSMAKRNRTEIVTKVLQQTAEDQANILDLEIEVIEFSLMSLAREAERLLAEYPKKVPKVYFTEDFDDPEKAPPGMVPSLRHHRATAGGGLEPIPISLDHQVFLLAPGVEKNPVASDIARLALLLPLHQEFERKLGDTLYWQYVYLVSGVHASYPGHGGYPGWFDPQNRRWFTLARERGELTWQAPYIDATSRQVVLTVSTPIRRPEGSFAGVAAADVLLTDIFQTQKLAARWSSAIRSLVIWQGENPETGEHGLWVFAATDQMSSAAGWDSIMNVEQLPSSDVKKMDFFVEQIESKKSGHLEMEYDGADSIWAYSHAGLGRGASLVFIVPKETVSAWVERPGNVLRLLVKRQWLLTGFVALAVILIVVITAFWVSSKMIRTLMIMVGAVKRLAAGDFSARMEIKTGDERELVANAFNEMVPQIEDRINIRKALEVAQEVQQNLLPQEIPDLLGFDIAAKSVYCDETGGDYFDFFPCGVSPERFGLAIGDVTGHGVAAALLMTTARALIRGLSTRPQTLAECITLVNRLLAADVRDSGNFMSLFVILLEPGSRTVRWVRAGHDPAMLFDPVAGRFEELAGPGLVLGVDETHSFEQLEKTIETPGTIILMGTDGIWEAHNADGEMFGKQRLYGLIRSHAAQTAESIQDEVLKALSAFRGDVAQEDDITLVVVKVL